METKRKINGILEKPPWLKVRACGSGKYLELQALLKEHHLHTVCQEANCPNRGECFSLGTATFLIMGPNCTRNCTFCNVTHGKCSPLDHTEPKHIARAVALLGLQHAVITSVTRDDLTDGGAGHFVRVIEAVRALPREITIEVLTPDFKGAEKDILTVLRAGPDVFNHNVETVPRLYKAVRPQADFERSLKVLKMARDYRHATVKSGLMVGLGETADELREVFIALKEAGVKMLTIGQYLAPSPRHHPVVRYYPPDAFTALAEEARRCGIASVFAAPLVRSSYQAGRQYRSQ